MSSPVTAHTPTAPQPAGEPLSADILEWLGTTDHKRVGLLYIVTAFTVFSIAGLLAVGMRAQLATPDSTLVSDHLYNQLFTVHGTLMLLFFATPVFIGFGNYFVPLQIGASDMAFARLNALGYWLYLGGAISVLLGFGTASGASTAGWTGYTPMTEEAFMAGPGVDLWIVGVMVVGFSGILGAINFIATIYSRRAPGMTLFRMPLFSWGILTSAVLILFSFPVLTSALAMLTIDRHLGGTFFLPSLGGSAILWQHLFWFFGHPEVYIVVIPAFGAISDIVPVFSGKPIFGYRANILSFMATAALSMSVWAHHMFTTGAVQWPFFSVASLLIALPTGVHFFSWIATMWGGSLRFPTPMLWAIAVPLVFTAGGITGVMVASPPIDYNAQDTYFVVAHFHNVLIGGTVFSAFAAVYYWFPKMTGRRLDERMGRLHVTAWVVGFCLTFLPQYQLGAEGMPRRVATYPDIGAWAALNLASSGGALLLAAGTGVFMLAVVAALRRPADQPEDPWLGEHLEWATSSPPPHHNFGRLPPIHSERPVFDARMAALGRGPDGLPLAPRRGAAAASPAGD